MYGFLLGREFKLSQAELLTVFSSNSIVYQSKEILILDGLKKDDILNTASFLGGTIKIIEIVESEETIENLILDCVNTDTKFKYGLSLYGEKKSLKEILNKTKKLLKEGGISSRFVNKDFNNLSSAQIKGENLIRKETDFTYIITSKVNYFGKSIWVQDIDSYSSRDYSKERDMQVGMLPPKLSQMMVNLSEGTTVYDPFVGLGTILIESLLMGNKKVFGSDLSEKMVETSTANIKKLISEKSLNADLDIFKLNAKFIEESEYFNEGVDAIVTEGYLGEIMTKKNIAPDRVQKQRDPLEKIYQAFFAGLQKINYSGAIVISFPFWEIRGKYYYFDEVYKILGKYCEVLPYFPTDYQVQASKSGSLLYKRPSQLVGREIFKLRMKK
ncbi:hypothetical protein A9Q91_03430 [Candidatus Gracilibacteria bacterium 28_42_T64]|nr:hypothetical protein A9Q91_03430 [Candidatus Gracilibacteria bacterium 28_42_T64]